MKGSQSTCLDDPAMLDVVGDVARCSQAWVVVGNGVKYALPGLVSLGCRNRVSIHAARCGNYCVIARERNLSDEVALEAVTANTVVEGEDRVGVGRVPQDVDAAAEAGAEVRLTGAEPEAAVWGEPQVAAGERERLVRDGTPVVPPVHGAEDTALRASGK